MIEQFFIDIDLNTKGVGKQAKEIDKMLDSMGMRAVKRSGKIERSKRKDLKGTANYQKYIINKRIKEDKAARDKEISNGRKSLQERLKVYKQSKQAGRDVASAKVSDFNRVEAALKANVEERFKKENKREQDLLKIKLRNNAKIKSSSEEVNNAFMKQHVKKMTAQDEELKKMKDFYAQQDKLAKAATKRQQAFANKIARFQSTAYYQNMKSSGKDMSSYDKRFGDAVRVGDTAAMTRLASEMRSVNRETKSLKRNMMGLNVVQGGLNDSTRNMIRSYASLFALFEGTVAIKRVGQTFQGIDASMLAAAGSADAAATDMLFINSIVDKMGLSLKDTTDAWVKFKFAAKGKISQDQQEDIFTGLSMFGTSLKVDDESMKRSQKALIQIDDYCLAA